MPDGCGGPPVIPATEDQDRDGEGYMSLEVLSPKTNDQTTGIKKQNKKA